MNIYNHLGLIFAKDLIYYACALSSASWTSAIYIKCLLIGSIGYNYSKNLFDYSSSKLSFID